MTDEARNKATESQALVESISPLLSGRDPMIVSVALADLLAMLIAGHRALDGNAAVTEALQRELLEMHIGLVRQLIPVNAAGIDEGVASGKITSDDFRELD